MLRSKFVAIDINVVEEEFLAKINTLTNKFIEQVISGNSEQQVGCLQEICRAYEMLTPKERDVYNKTLANHFPAQTSYASTAATSAAFCAGFPLACFTGPAFPLVLLAGYFAMRNKTVQGPRAEIGKTSGVFVRQALARIHDYLELKVVDERAIKQSHEEFHAHERGKVQRMVR